MNQPKHAVIYNHGEGYLHSAKKLQQGLSNPPDPDRGEQFHIISSGLVAVHALELFFRALHQLHVSEDETEEDDLKALYDRLPEDAQDRLKQRYNDHMNPEVIERFEEKTGTSVQDDFEDALSVCRDIFQQVRNIHERETPIPMPLLFTMIQAAKYTYRDDVEQAAS